MRKTATNINKLPIFYCFTPSDLDDINEAHGKNIGNAEKESACRMSVFAAFSAHHKFPLNIAIEINKN